MRERHIFLDVRLPSHRTMMTAGVRHMLGARGSALAAVALLAACTAPRDVAGPAQYPLRFIVSNDLVAPVTVSVDGVPQLGLQAGKSSGLTVQSTAQFLTWTSAKTMDANGRVIPDDIGEVRIAVASVNHEVEINNVIGRQPYITAGIFNHTASPVSIGVYDGISVSCAAALPAASSTRTGFTQIGYYRLLPSTEVRAYRDPTNCTGPFLAWPPAMLRGYMEKSGLLALSLDSAP